MSEVSQLSDADGRRFDAKGTRLFTLAEVNAALDTARCGVLRSLTSAGFPEAGRPVAALRTARALFHYNWKDRRVEWSIPLERGIGHQDFAPTSRALAYTKDYNLYVTTADGRQHAVSTDGSRELLYGTSVHRDEFGIHKGTFWSPDGPPSRLLPHGSKHGHRLSARHHRRALGRAHRPTRAPRNTPWPE